MIKKYKIFYMPGSYIQKRFFYELFNFVKMSYEYEILINKKIDFKTYNQLIFFIDARKL